MIVKGVFPDHAGVEKVALTSAHYTLARIAQSLAGRIDTSHLGRNLIQAAIPRQPESRLE
jgi:hypothetical protein